MTGVGRHSPESGDTIRTRWPWDSPFAWAMPSPRKHRRKRSEGDDLARLRRTWADAYDIPEPARKRWPMPPRLAARNRETGVPLTARTADALERKILDDYAGGLGPADRTAWPAEIPAPPAADPPPAFGPVPPPAVMALASDEGWPDDGMRTMCDPGGPVRMNRRYASRDRDAW